MPFVSVVMPAYNRADTVRRAAESVLAQSFGDLELIVVDDGSTDGTGDAVRAIDPRVVVVTHARNQGMTPARNTGLARARGDYVAFLDSDDEWLPHHLELCLAFLAAHPDAEFVTAEFWERFGPDQVVRHWRLELDDWYPALAREIGSHRLDLPDGERDGYLRVYRSKAPIGEWGRDIVARTGYADVFHYRGWVFDAWRWGFLGCLQPTVLRRRLLERVGPFETAHGVAADYPFLAEVCRVAEAHLLSIPTAVKHEYAAGGQVPSEDHLATGKHRFSFARDMLYWFDELYWKAEPHDRELCALRGTKAFWVGRTAMLRGQYEEALRYLGEAARDAPWMVEATVLGWLLRIVPGRRLACATAINAYAYTHKVKAWLGHG